MNLSKVREGELKEIFDALEQAFAANGIDHYLIGAIARDIWYGRRNQVTRQTKDVDFAVYVGSQANYDALRKYLADHKGFHATKTNAFVMIAPGGAQIDILPFGGIEIDGEVKVEGGGLTSISVTGFSEVYGQGTEAVKLETGHVFNVATLPAIVLLKLVAFDDRPEQRLKDPGDIALIIDHFYELQLDRIAAVHADLFEDEALSLPEISSIVIGREMKKICAGNKKLFQRMSRILADHIEKAANSSFVRHMNDSSGPDIETRVGWLKRMQRGLTN